MLEIKTLSVSYGEYPVLKGVSLQVHPGKILSVIGPNGAGKSTLIRATSGVIPTQAGNIYVRGEDLCQLTPSQRARRISVVPQAHNLPNAFSVYQTVLLGRTPYLGWMGQASQMDHFHVRRALEQTHLQDLAERRIGTLSGGEQQRVLLARALAQNTPVLLLDEPTTYLDLKHQSNFLNLVQSQAKANQLAVIMVMHDINLAGLYSDQIALLVSGNIMEQGSPSQVLTGANLAYIYEIPVNVIPHPEYGSPIVLPDGRE